MTNLTIRKAYREFPNFDWQPDDLQRVLNQLGQGWSDTCDCVDACPTYRNKALRLRLWIDYQNQKLRAMPDSPLFLLECVDEFGESLAVPSICETDSYDCILDKIALVKLTEGEMA